MWAFFLGKTGLQTYILADCFFPHIFDLVYLIILVVEQTKIVLQFPILWPHIVTLVGLTTHNELDNHHFKLDVHLIVRAVQIPCCAYVEYLTLLFKTSVIAARQPVFLVTFPWIGQLYRVLCWHLKSTCKLNIKAHKIYCKDNAIMRELYCLKLKENIYEFCRICCPSNKSLTCPNVVTILQIKAVVNGKQLS